MIGTQFLLSISNDRLRRLAPYASIGIAALLIAAKMVACLMTGSVAMLSSLFDSVFDLLASVVTAYAVNSALKPPDYDHRYGHGKAEPLAALAQALLIIGSSIFLTCESVMRFLHPQPVTHEAIGYEVTLLALILTVGLVLFQHFVVRRTGSIAIGADQAHYIGDLAVNLAVIAAFVLNAITGSTLFDPLFALAIAAGMLFSAAYILRKALLALMDAELPDATREKILAIAKRQPGVHGVHDMRTRSDGDRIFIEFHAEMDGSISLLQAHELAEQIDAAICAELPNADVLVHQDPAGMEGEHRLDVLIERQQ